MVVINLGKIRGKSSNVNALFLHMLTFGILQERDLRRKNEPAKRSGLDHGRK